MVHGDAKRCPKCINKRRKADRQGRTEDRLTKLITEEFYDRADAKLIPDLIEETGLAECVVLDVLHNDSLSRQDMPAAFTKAIYGEMYLD